MNPVAPLIVAATQGRVARRLLTNFTRIRSSYRPMVDVYGTCCCQSAAYRKRTVITLNWYIDRSTSGCIRAINTQQLLHEISTDAAGRFQCQTGYSRRQ